MNPPKPPSNPRYGLRSVTAIGLGTEGTPGGTPPTPPIGSQALIVAAE